MSKFMAVLAFGVLLSSCSTAPYQPYAREVKKFPAEGGILALHREYRDEDRSKAQQIMNSNCGDGNIVKIKEEGEVAVSEKTVTSNSSHETKENTEAFSIGGLKFLNAEPSKGTSGESVSQTEQIKEWQITYGCVAVTNTKPAAAKKVSKKSL